MEAVDGTKNTKRSRKLLLVIVYIALFLDNMLLTSVVPIMPEYLFRLDHPKSQLMGGSSSIDVLAGRYSGSPIDYWGDQKGRTAGKPQPTKRSVIQSNESQSQPPKQKNRVITRSSLKIVNHTMQRASQLALGKLELDHRHQLLTAENVHVGLMFGSKAFVQLFCNLFVGPLTNRIGYSVPMFTGFVIMFFSTLLFAYGRSYGVLFFARAVQGIGSSCTSTAGMGMIAQAYPDDQERGAAMGFALGGLALGVLIGPPFGGVLYQWSGKELPFGILAMLALVDGVLQFFVLRPHIDKAEREGSSLKTLVRDPYIAAAAGSITIGNLGIAMLEPTLPLWMIETMHAGSATRGAAFLPCSIGYLIGTSIFGALGHKFGRCWISLCGLLIIGCCLFAVPSAESVSGLVAPNGFMGFAIGQSASLMTNLSAPGMIDSSMFPHMGFLVDLRHAGVYGNIYAISDATFCFAFCCGPFLSALIIKLLSFPVMMYIVGVITILYAPVLFWTRNPPQQLQENQMLLNEGIGAPPSYTRFDNEPDDPNWSEEPLLR